jgi:hypothetical protein
MNRIGPFTFISLSKPPEAVQDRLAIHRRAGVDGNMLQNLGTWGDPLEVESLAGAISFTRAMQLSVEYKALPGGDAQQVIWSGADFTAINHLFFVLNVAIPPDGIYRIVRGHGPDGDYFAEIRAVWTLLPIRF